MIKLKFTGDFKDLKGFFKGGKDPFCEGTYYKALGNSAILLIRQDRDIKIRLFDIIASKPDLVKPLLEKLNIPFEEIEYSNDTHYIEKDFTEEEKETEREEELEWQER